MQSKRLCFSWGIFKKNMQRFWLLPFSMFAVLYLTFISPNNYFQGNLLGILRAGTVHIVLLSAAYGCFAVMCCFSYLYRSNSAYMLHTLPVNRKSLFFSNYLSGYAMVFVPMLIATLWVAIAQLSYNSWIFSSSDFLLVCDFFADFILQSLFFYSFAVFCAMLTGNIIAMPLLYAILNFTVVVLELLLRAMSGVYIYGMKTGDFFRSLSLLPFSPFAYIFGHLTGGYVSIDDSFRFVWGNGWLYLICLGIVAVLLTFLSYCSYRRRDLECAGDVISHCFLRPVFKYCWTFGCSVVLGSGIFGLLYINVRGASAVWIPYTVCLLVGAFIGYFSAEMLLRKSLRVFRVGAKGFGAAAAVILLLCCLFRFDVFGVAARIPAIDDIDQLTVKCDLRGEYTTFRYTNLNDPRQREAVMQWQSLHKQLVDNRNTLLSQLASLPEGSYYYGAIEKQALAAENKDGYYIVYPLADIVPYQISPALQYGWYGTSYIEFDYVLGDGIRASKTLQRSYKIPATPLIMEDKASAASHYKSLLNNSVVHELSYEAQELLSLNAEDIMSINLLVSGDEGEYHAYLEKPLYGTLLEAFKQDINEGKLLKFYMYGESEYYSEYTTMLINVYYEKLDKPKQVNVRLLTCSEHSIEALQQLGLLAD